MPRLTVEFFGIPRLLAGVSEITLSASTFRELLKALTMTIPALSGMMTADGSLSPQYLCSLDGVRFHIPLDQPLQADSRVLLLSADVGG